MEASHQNLTFVQFVRKALSDHRFVKRSLRKTGIGEFTFPCHPEGVHTAKALLKEQEIQHPECQQYHRCNGFIVGVSKGAP